MISRKLMFVIAVLDNALNLYAFRSFDVNGIETLFAMENETVNINCKTDMSMEYCGFIHPNGKRYSFSGTTLSAGQCAIKIRASANDNGEWRCHIGSKGSIGVEIMQYIHVRVVEELAALQKNISTVHGKPVTIACATTKGLIPLRYCRFEPPNGNPFSINSDVSVTNPILGRYYYPQNKSVDRGDCAVTIRKVKYEDVGVWTCGVGLDDGKGYIDTVSLEVEGLYMMTTASATGITFGAIAVFLAILGVVVWKKRRFLGTVPAEEQEMEQLRQLRVERSRRASPHGSRTTSPHGSRKTSPQGSRTSPHGSRRSSLHGSRRSSPHGSRKSSPHGSRRSSPQGTRKTSPHGSRRSPHRSRKDSPLCRRIPLKSSHSTSVSVSADVDIPEITIQSPSDKSINI